MNLKRNFKRKTKSKLLAAVIAGSAISIYCYGPSVVNKFLLPASAKDFAPADQIASIEKVDPYNAHFMNLFYKDGHGHERKLAMANKEVAIDEQGNVVCTADFTSGARSFGALTEKTQEKYKDGLQTACGEVTLSKKQVENLPKKSIFKP